MALNQKFLAGMAAVLFALSALALFGFWLASFWAERQVEATHKLIECMQSVETSAQPIGTNLRLYVNSDNDSELLKKYRLARAHQEDVLHTLDAALLQRLDQQDNLAVLHRMILERLTWEDKLLSLYDRHQMAEVVKLNAGTERSLITVKVRKQLKEMEEREEAILKDEDQTYRIYKSLCLVAVVVLSVFGSVALWQAIKKSLLSRRLEAEQIIAYERLEAMNNDLNKQVRDLIQSQEQANKAIGARAEFLAKVSHNLRTPLTGIIGATELALENPLSEQQRSLLKIVQQSSHQLLGLVNDILDFERMELQEFELEPDAFDLPIAIQAAVQPLQIKAKDQGIVFSVDIGRDVPYLVYGDRLRIQQVLVNLVDNAIKYTKTGSVAVAVSSERSSAEKRNVRFTVSDTGAGLLPEQLAKLKTLHADDGHNGNHASEPSEGGIGLSVAKKLIKLLDGEMEAVSENGRGTTISFVIPLNISAPTQEEIVAETHTAVRIEESPCVLAVDDNAVIRLVTESQLKRLGFDVETAASGDEAIELSNARAYTLIFMDVQMPGIDGLEATRRIRAMANNPCRSVPIIAYTAHAMPGDEEKFRQAGMSDYIAKPITLASLQAIMQKWASKDLAVKDGLPQSN